MPEKCLFVAYCYCIVEDEGQGSPRERTERHQVHEGYAFRATIFANIESETAGFENESLPFIPLLRRRYTTLKAGLPYELLAIGEDARRDSVVEAEMGRSYEERKLGLA